MYTINSDRQYVVWKYKEKSTMKPIEYVYIELFMMRDFGDVFSLVL